MNAIELNNVSKQYPGRARLALDNLSLTVEQGDFFGLLGPNGAGKSTTLNMISGLVRKDSGRILIQGLDKDIHPFETKQLLGIVPQELNVNIFEKVMDIVLTQGGYYGFSRAELMPWCQEILKRLDLWSLRDSAVRTLSGGMKRRLMIARGLIHRPSILILDEPTTGVDVKLRRDMWEFLKEINAMGTTILLTSHYLEEVEHLCRNVAIVDHGKLLLKTSMEDLLSHVEREVFIIKLVEPTESCLTHPTLQFKNISSHTLSVSKEKDQTLDDIFTYLASQGLRISSLKPQTNRLESLFMTMTEQQGVAHE